MNQRLFIAGTVVGLGLITVLITSLALRPKVVQRGVPIPGSPGSMDVLEVRERSGFRAFNRGLRLQSKARFVKFPRTNDFWSAIDDELERRVREANEKFTSRFSWPLFRLSLEKANSDFDFEQTVSWKASWASPKLVSLLATYHDYHGRAHGNKSFMALNAVPDAFNSWQGFTLDQCFVSTSGWRKPVAALVAAEFSWQEHVRRRADQDNYFEASIPFNELAETPFTIGREGFSLWYGHTENDSFADDSLEVFISYEKILHLLDTNGPARWLPCFPETR